MSQAFQFDIPVHEGILPDRRRVDPGVALLGGIFPGEDLSSFSKGGPPTEWLLNCCIAISILGNKVGKYKMACR